MSSSAIEFREVTAQTVSLSDDDLTVELSDGRSLSVPLSWFPRLLHGTVEERRNWRLVGSGEGIHWPALDEDISVEGLLAGRPSAESAASLQRWLNQTARSSKSLQGTGGHTAENSADDGEAAGP
jgi:Protein of unknown function (DUF2442)